MDDDSTLAGWHRDPSGRHELRFWNGDHWTEHVIDDGIPGLDAPTRSGRAPGAVASTPPPPPPEAEAEPADVETTEVEHADDDIIDLEAAEAVEPVVVDLGAAEAIESVAVDSKVNTAAEADRAPAMSTTSQRTEARAGSITTPGHTRPAPTEPPPGVRARITPSVEPKAAVVTPEPVVEPEAVVEAEPEPEAVVEAEPEAVVEPDAVVEPEPEPVVEAEPEAEAVVEPEPEPVVEPEVSRRGATTRAVIVGPSVASPAGNSAGSNTSAIADPHVAVGAATPRERADAPRVAGVSPVPVKRYRPGSPPPSPFARPTALPASTEPIGTIVQPWYRKPLVWVATALVAALIGATVVVLVDRSAGDAGSARLGGRAPAGAPRGNEVIDGDGFGIAAPIGWITTSDPGRTFPQLRRTNWATPLAAIDPGSRQGLIVVPLHDLAHQPQVDPDLFWSDQVVDAGSGHSIQENPPFGVHGFRANRVTITDLSGTVMVAAAIDTGDRTYLVAFTGPDSATANDRFERLIQTFDAR